MALSGRGQLLMEELQGAGKTHGLTDRKKRQEGLLQTGKPP